MKELLVQFILAAVRHLLTAAGFEKVWNDADLNSKIVGGVVFAVGFGLSLARKVKAQREAAANAPVSKIAPTLMVLALAASVVGCASNPSPTKLNRWEQISRAAAYGGSISWLKDHPQDCAKFSAVADEFAVMAKQEFVIMSDFLRVARQLPVHELRDNGSVLLVTEFVVVVLDGNGALESDKVQIYLKPIINGAATGLRLGVDRFCNSPAK